MSAPNPDAQQDRQLLFDSSDFGRKELRNGGLFFLGIFLPALMVTAMVYAVYILQGSEGGILIGIFFLIVGAIALIIFAAGIQETRHARTGSLPVRIYQDGVHISATYSDRRRRTQTFIPMQSIVSIHVLRSSEEDTPSAFRIFTKDGRRIFSGTRTKREMEALATVFEELRPEICQTRTAFVFEVRPEGPPVEALSEELDSAPSGQPLFDSAQYEDLGDVTKDTSILSKSIIALSITAVVLLVGAFTIDDLVWFSLVMIVVLALSIIVLILVRMYVHRKLENVQLRLEVFRNGIRVNVGFWDIMKNRRRFIPIQKIRRVGFLAPTEDAVPKGCAFELWDGKEIFPGWKNEAEMKALKRTMEELMPEKVTWVEHRKLRLDDFF